MSLGGSLVALITPMELTGAIDFSALTGLVDFHLQEQTDGLVVAGTTGESATLDEGEFSSLIEAVQQQVAGAIPVIAGTGSADTQKTIKQTKCAQALGADAALVVTPYYSRPSQEGLYAHYMAVADAVDLPVILYNVPSRTACDLQPDTVARLSGHQNIVGLKEAVPDRSRIQQLVAAVGTDMVILSGDDATCVQSVLAGAVGVISVAANIIPRTMHEMVKLARRGEAEAALQMAQTWAALTDVLFIESNPIPVKWSIYRMGLAERGIRLPLQPLAEHLQPALEKHLLAHRLIEK